MLTDTALTANSFYVNNKVHIIPNVEMPWMPHSVCVGTYMPVALCVDNL